MIQPHEAFTEQMLAEARADVLHADQKASLLLAALGIGFGAVVSGELSGDFVPASLPPGQELLWWVGVAFAIASVTAAGAAVWPRYTLKDNPQYGLTYWGHVAAHKDLRLLRHQLRDSSLSSFDRSSHQLWRLSRLVLVKYRYIRLAMLAVLVAVPILAAATLLPT